MLFIDIKLQIDTCQLALGETPAGTGVSWYRGLQQLSAPEVVSTARGDCGGLL